MAKERVKDSEGAPKIPPRRRKTDPAAERALAEDRVGAGATTTPPGAGLPEFGGPAAPMPGEEREWELSQEDIGRRAYEIYQDRGAEHGRDLDDWLAAEDELRRKREREK